IVVLILYRKKKGRHDVAAMPFELRKSFLILDEDVTEEDDDDDDGQQSQKEEDSGVTNLATLINSLNLDKTNADKSLQKLKKDLSIRVAQCGGISMWSKKQLSTLYDTFVIYCKESPGIDQATF